jgi:DNA repair protein RadC
MSHYRIADMVTSERPRERLALLGAEVLSSYELLALLLRSGLPGLNVIQLAQQLLNDTGGLAGLHRISFDALCELKGVGPAKASQIKAAIELGRRLSIATPNDKPEIHSPDDAAGLLMYEMGALEQEQLRVLLLNTRNQLDRIVEVYQGSLNASLIRIGEVFRDAVRVNAASIIIAHNHPSGDPSPSPEDIRVTTAIIEAGKLLDIEVLDHLVIGKNCFVSLKSKGMAFSRVG